MIYLIKRSILASVLVVFIVPVATILFPIVLTGIIVAVVFNMPVNRERVNVRNQAN